MVQSPAAPSEAGAARIYGHGARSTKQKAHNVRLKIKDYVTGVAASRRIERVAYTKSIQRARFGRENPIRGRTPVSRPADRAYEAIHDAIVNADYPPGHHLKEEVLSQEIGVSRTPVREALRRLANEGLVVFARNHGTFVETFTAADVDEIFQLRAMLEAHGAARAAARIDAATLARLEQLTEEMERLRDRAGDDEYIHRFNSVNAEFHKLLLGAAQSRRLNAMLAAVIDIPLILMKHYNWHAAVNLERSCQQHWELIAALRARDAEWAASLMRAHILGARGDPADLPGRNEAPAPVPEELRSNARRAAGH